MRLSACLVSCALVASCGGSSTDVEGVYRASTHTQDQNGCGLGASVGDFPLFKLGRVDFLGHVAYKYEPCTSTDACLDLGALSIRFTVETSDGFTDDTFNGMGSSSSCTLTRTVSMLTRQGDGMVRVEFQKLSAVTSTSGACDDAAARAAASSLPCVSDEVMIAARVK
jgi:hypothetical protein